MNLERFRETLDLMIGLDDDLRLQQTLEQIRDSLNNLVASPAHPNHQASLANALTSFSTACAKLGGELSPQKISLIGELHGSKYFDPLMADSIKTQIAANAMTPSVPRDSVQEFTTERARYITNIKSVRDGLEDLQISASTHVAGTADLTFAIPREIFDNKLGNFAKELAFLNRLMVHLSEAIAGKAEPVELETLSSSIPTVAITAGAKLLSALAELIGKFLEAWQKIEKFRSARQQLTELGLSGKALEEVSESIASTVEEVVEESVEIVLSGFGGENTRKNELRNALTQDIRRLFGQIELGLTVQFRADTNDAEPDDAPALNAIEQASQTLRFPQVQPEPMLLGSGDRIEGDVPAFRYVKRTTSKKTTTTKTTK